MPIALSGRKLGSTLTPKDLSSAIFLCHSRLSAGSSVVQRAFTFDCSISLRADMVCSFSLQRFQTVSAVSPFRTPS